MKYVKIIFFILAIIVSGTALFVNFIIVNSKNMGDDNALDSIEVVYLDSSQISEGDYQKIVEFVSSSNQTVFNKYTKQKRAVEVFYGFCGYMKTNQKYVMDKLLEEMLVSTRQVRISYEGKTFNSYLGYAVLLLLDREPDWLINPTIKSFYVDGEQAFRNAYKSSVSKSDIDYKNLITKIAVKNTPVFQKS
jgi:hypothetical protein